MTSLHGIVAWIQTWSEIRTDVELNWLIYLSMPFVAAFVGWSTKIVAVEMLYRPIEYRGKGPFGWQGIVPRRAGKVASKTIELFTENLLRPEDLLDRFDAREAVTALREPLLEVVDEIAQELADQLRPGSWDALPEAGRRAIRSRVIARAPGIVDSVIREMRSDLSRYVDLQMLAVSTLVRNKANLNKLMRSMSDEAMSFMRRSGIWFGFGIGMVQMVAWGVFHNPWLMPAFGFAVGFVSDYIALNLLFRPIHPTTYLGVIRFQGILHAQREKVTREYAKILADDLFSPENLLEAIIQGPSADKLFALVAKEVDAALDAELGLASPFVALTIGTRRYRAAKGMVATAVVQRLPTALVDARGYTAEVIDLENTIIEKMGMLTNEQYEAILRPVFKDDEPLVIAVGALLGGVVGEIQVLIMEHFARHA